MSSVRMCDRCGNMFSEREDGWQTYTAATIKRTSDGRQVSIDVALDACPKCAINSTMGDPLTPRLAAPKRTR